MTMPNGDFNLDGIIPDTIDSVYISELKENLRQQIFDAIYPRFNQVWDFERKHEWIEPPIRYWRGQRIQTDLQIINGSLSQAIIVKDVCVSSPEYPRYLRYAYEITEQQYLNYKYIEELAGD